MGKKWGEKGKAPPLNPRRKKTSNLGRPARVDHPRRPSPAAHAPTQSAAERKDRQREDIGGPVHDSYDGKCHTDRVKRKPDVQRLCGMVPYFCTLDRSRVRVGNTVWDVIGMSLSSVCSSILPANDTSNAFHHCADRLTLLREVTEGGNGTEGGGSDCIVH